MFKSILWGWLFLAGFSCLLCSSHQRRGMIDVDIGDCKVEDDEIKTYSKVYKVLQSNWDNLSAELKLFVYMLKELKIVQVNNKIAEKLQSSLDKKEDLSVCFFYDFIENLCKSIFEQKRFIGTEADVCLIKNYYCQKSFIGKFKNFFCCRNDQIIDYHPFFSLLCPMSKDHYLLQRSASQTKSDQNVFKQCFPFLQYESFQPLMEKFMLISDNTILSNSFDNKVIAPRRTCWKNRIISMPLLLQKCKRKISKTTDQNGENIRSGTLKKSDSDNNEDEKIAVNNNTICHSLQNFFRCKKHTIWVDVDGENEKNKKEVKKRSSLFNVQSAHDFEIMNTEIEPKKQRLISWLNVKNSLISIPLMLRKCRNRVQNGFQKIIWFPRTFTAHYDKRKDTVISLPEKRIMYRNEQFVHRMSNTFSSVMSGTILFLNDKYYLNMNCGPMLKQYEIYLDETSILKPSKIITNTLLMMPHGLISIESGREQNVTQISFSVPSSKNNNALVDLNALEIDLKKCFSQLSMQFKKSDQGQNIQNNRRINFEDEIGCKYNDDDVKRITDHSLNFDHATNKLFGDKIAVVYCKIDNGKHHENGKNRVCTVDNFSQQFFQAPETSTDQYNPYEQQDIKMLFGLLVIGCVIALANYDTQCMNLFSNFKSTMNINNYRYGAIIMIFFLAIGTKFYDYYIKMSLTQ